MEQRVQFFAPSIDEEKALGVTSGRFVKQGILTHTEGSIRLRGKRERVWLTRISGIFGAIVGVAAIVAIVMLLEEIGVELMRYRKGPMLIGVLGMIGMGAGWALVGDIVGRVTAKESTVEVPRANVRVESNGDCFLVWHESGKRHAVWARSDPSPGFAPPPNPSQS